MKIGKCIMLLSSAILIGCTNQKSEEVAKESKDKLEPEITHEEEVVLNHASHDIELEIDFIEALESGWSSSYKDSRLMQKGFSRTTGGSGENIAFKHSESGNALLISKLIVPDGATAFTVSYSFSAAQLHDIKSSIKNFYELKSKVEEVEKYEKAGLGTYESKLVELSYSENKIIYTHYVGKELQVPGPIIIE